MKFRIAFVLISAFFSSFAGAVTTDLNVKLVTELGKEEPHEALLSQAGVQWVGNNRGDGGSIAFAVEVYNADGKLLAKTPMKHSVDTIAAFGANKVIVVGEVSNPWQSYFSILSYSNGRISVDSHSVPEENLIGNFAGDASTLYFSEVGDNNVLHWTGSKMVPLKSSVRTPGRLVKVGNSIFIIEMNNIFGGSENFVKIDLGTDTAQRAFTTTRRKLSHLIYLPNRNQIAVTESYANQVLFIDAATNTLKDTIAIEGNPAGVATLGHCLAVSSNESKHVTFIDLNQATPTIIADWDLNGAGDRLKQPTAISFDQATGTLFARSNYPCPSCVGTQSSVFSFREPTGATAAQCSK